MDWGTIITSAAVTSLLGTLALVVKSIISSNSERTGYDRKREERLENKVAELEKRVDGKDEQLDTQAAQISILMQDINEIIIKAQALIHKVTNMQGAESLQYEISELEKQIKKDRNK